MLLSSQALFHCLFIIILKSGPWPQFDRWRKWGFGFRELNHVDQAHTAGTWWSRIWDHVLCWFLNLYLIFIFFFNGSIADLQSYISFRDHAFQYLGKCNEWMSKWMTNELNYSRPYLFLRGWEGKEYASNAGNQVRYLGPEDLLKKVMATHSSFLAWRIPWREEPGELQSMGLQRVRDDWATNTFTSVIY